MLERTVVEFFFSPGSRYSYLAASQVPRIRSATGCTFDWRPVRGTEIRALRRRDPFDGRAVSGQYDWSYRRRDAEMWAAYYGIPFREPPGPGLDLDLLARAAAAGRLLGAAETYGWALCHAAYGSETWPVDRQPCLDLAEQVGLARSALDALLGDPAAESLLSDAAREAYERGAFGVPTFFCAGRMYWGNDRLVLLEHALRERGRDSTDP